MKIMLKNDLKETSKTNLRAKKNYFLAVTIAESWSKIAPLWPLKNLIAVNPMAGFEDLAFEEALKQANVYFQQKEIPRQMQCVNRESIKWLQVFFDEGQATIAMPMRKLGLLKSTLSLIRFDTQLHKNNLKKQQWLKQLSAKPEALIAEALLYLRIAAQDQEQFLTLILTTLPGWASYVQYRTHWTDAKDAAHPHTVTASEYLAFRLILTCLIWPKAKQLLAWHQAALKNADISASYQTIAANEALYQKTLFAKLNAASAMQKTTSATAQLVFCIDVRSEPFRRALEAQGDYETYGFAGFFGVPVAIENASTGELYASCPVLLKPGHKVVERPNIPEQAYNYGHQRQRTINKLYQSLKYTFTTPFSLVETLGMLSGLWMGLRSFFPQAAAAIQTSLKQAITPHCSFSPDIETISLEQQVAYGAGVLKIIGLTDNFAPLIVFCAHASTTQNNSYATALDCGACGGRPGGPNAKILVQILNNPLVRNELKKLSIIITEATHFLAAEHNTTTDEVEIYADDLPAGFAEQLKDLKKDLQSASNANSFWRSSELGIKTDAQSANQATGLQAKDWAQVRPEWGLARNAAFIIGPRSFTKNINLEGRVFLHSYEWQKDSDAQALTTILTAPMVVAHWINAQYFFSSFDNISFGGGSKITQNITGKIGVMQGNASDIMHGLPLQSVFKSDHEAYHQSIRLTVIVRAPQTKIELIIKQQYVLQKLFGNGWIHLICDDPIAKRRFKLQRDLTWTAASVY